MNPRGEDGVLMGLNVKIRAANEDDIPILLELLDQLGRPKPRSGAQRSEFARMVSMQISDPDCGMLVAFEADASILGTASMLFLPRLNRTGPEMYIPELIVRNGHRGRGVGSALFDACVKVAMKRGCHRIRLESGNTRRDSHRFYAKKGFDQSALSFSMDL